MNARAESLAARHDSAGRRINELRAELLQGYPTEIGPEVTRTLDELGVPRDHFLRGVIAASMRSVEARAFQEHEPPPWAAAEAVHLSEAEQLLSERNECKIQVDRRHQALQVLDGHNRVLQHLLCEARRGRRGHCPQKRGAWRPRRWQWWGTWCPRRWCSSRATRAERPQLKYTVKAHDPLLVALDVQAQHPLPAPRRFTNADTWAKRQEMVDSREFLEFVTFYDVHEDDDEATQRHRQLDLAQVVAARQTPEADLGAPSGEGPRLLTRIAVSAGDLDALPMASAPSVATVNALALESAGRAARPEPYLYCVWCVCVCVCR